MMEEEGLRLYVSDDSSDTTRLSYWANWRVLVCAIWVFTPMILAFWTIWRYESRKSFAAADDDDDDRNRNRDSIGDEAWKPCLRGIHPIWVLIFRVVAFFALLATLIAKIYYSGGSTYFYYTQWTFTLLTLYFALGSALSFIGCLKYAKVSRFSVSGDTEQGLHAALVSNETEKSSCDKRNASSLEEKSDSVFRSLRFWTCFLEIIFQINVGAVTLTDLVYWFVIYPFLTTQDYSPSGLAIAMHSINAVFLLGDAALNCLQVPLMRMTFFILWTGFYVVFQWIFHAFVPLWWAYPFLDLSLPYSPLWYLLVASLHIPCYCLFVLFVKIKRYSLSKCFPSSCQC